MNTVIDKLKELGLTSAKAESIAKFLDLRLKMSSPLMCWQQLVETFFLRQDYPFEIQLFLYKVIYPFWDKEPAPAWFPGEEMMENSNISALMHEKGFTDYNALHEWSTQNYSDFWRTMVTKLNIIFDQDFSHIINLENGIENPLWFEGSKLNIINSCFQADPKAIAIISQNEQGHCNQITYEVLNTLSDSIAKAISCRFLRGDSLAIIMPMTIDAIAIYLGIIKAGCVVVSIADSFSTEEIASRLNISKARAVFTQSCIHREDKKFDLYQKVISADSPMTVVLPESFKELDQNSATCPLREKDITWDEFLLDSHNKRAFSLASCNPYDPINILFSSGTTGDPKAIPWTQSTPIKCSSDAYLHHNLQSGDIFCWPTNLGWMMGPWLIFATLINKATIGLYLGSPNRQSFGQFIANHKITHLGVVPTLVRTWRNSACMENLDWSSIKLFSSTGECSNVEDMLYLMSLAHYRPIIEYCGGTEIGGAYITGSVVQASAPAALTTAALGIDFVILNEDGQISNKGEVALIPPSIGLSTELLNKNHHENYYHGMPTLNNIPLRRHGDELERYPNGFYRLHGRVDDTMNLAGIKVSAAEIERVLNNHAAILDSAAITIEPEMGGPSHLIIFAVLAAIPKLVTQAKMNKNELKFELQSLLKEHLNPLFKIHEVIIIEALPRTASNKVMRRVLRSEYERSTSNTR